MLDILHRFLIHQLKAKLIEVQLLSSFADEWSIFQKALATFLNFFLLMVRMGFGMIIWLHICVKNSLESAFFIHSKGIWSYPSRGKTKNRKRTCFKARHIRVQITWLLFQQFNFIFMKKKHILPCRFFWWGSEGELI